MGRKGVSKRKPSQTKAKPLSSTGVQATENLPVKSLETGKAASSSDSKKNPKKG